MWLSNMNPWVKSMCFLMSFAYPIQHHLNKQSDVTPLLSAEQPNTPNNELVPTYYCSKWAHGLFSSLSNMFGFDYNYMEEFCDELEVRFGDALKQIDLSQMTDHLSNSFITTHICPILSSVTDLIVPITASVKELIHVPLTGSHIATAFSYFPDLLLPLAVALLNVTLLFIVSTVLPAMFMRPKVAAFVGSSLLWQGCFSLVQQLPQFLTGIAEQLKLKLGAMPVLNSFRKDLAVLFSVEFFENLVTKGLCIKIGLLVLSIVCYHSAVVIVLFRMLGRKMRSVLGMDSVNLGGTCHVSELSICDSLNCTLTAEQLSSTDPEILCEQSLDISFLLNNPDDIRCRQQIGYRSAPASFFHDDCIAGEADEADLDMSGGINCSIDAVAKPAKRARSDTSVDQHDFVESIEQMVRDFTSNDDLLTSTPRKNRPAVPTFEQFNTTTTTSLNTTFESVNAQDGSSDDVGDDVDDFRSVPDDSNMDDTFFYQNITEEQACGNKFPWEPSPKKLKRFLQERKDEVNHNGINPEALIEEEQKVDTLLLSMSLSMSGACDHSLGFDVSAMRDRVLMKRYIVAPRLPRRVNL